MNIGMCRLIYCIHIIDVEKLWLYTVSVLVVFDAELDSSRIFFHLTGINIIIHIMR